MRILITGANGFLGSHLVEHAVKSNHSVFSGIRKGANLQYIDGLNTTLTELNYQESKNLTNQLKILRKESPFDLIIHNAGLTKSDSKKKNLDINKGITENLLKAVSESGALHSNGKFVYISSMAALGPVGANGPVSTYGWSKLQAEKSIIESGLPYSIFRPSAIYGPRDKAFLPMFKSAKWGLYPNISSPNQKITMILASDVARVILYLSKSHTNNIFHLDDGHVYSHKNLVDALGAVFNKKIVKIQVPKMLVLSGIFLIEKVVKLFGGKAILTIEKYKEISQDWNHDFSSERKQMDQLSLTPLDAGFLKTYQYYHQQKLL